MKILNFLDVFSFPDPRLNGTLSSESELIQKKIEQLTDYQIHKMIPNIDESSDESLSQTLEQPLSKKAAHFNIPIPCRVFPCLIKTSDHALPS